MSRVDYSIAIAIAIPVAFLVAFAASLWLEWRRPKSTHRWPK